MKSFYEDDKELRDVLKNGISPDKPIRKQFICDEVKIVDENKLTVDFIISTTSVDRYGDTVSVDGWDFKNFKKNPVVLFAHDSMSPPIARCIPKSLTTDKNKLYATAEFMNKDLYDFSFMIFQMYAKGFMKATSVGFRPTEWSFVEDDNRPFGVDYHKQELLEFSCVPIPANPEALVNAKSMGIELSPLKSWAEKTLDTWEKHKGILLPRDVVENVYKNSKSPERKKTMTVENLIKINTDNDTVKSVSAVTGEFDKTENKHAIVLTRGNESKLSVQDLDCSSAIGVLADSIAMDATIKGYVLEVGKLKGTNEMVFKKLEEKDVDSTEPPNTVVCPGCGQQVICQRDDDVCPLCGYSPLKTPGKAVSIPEKKTTEVESLTLKITLDDTLKSFLAFANDKETVTKNLNDLMEVYLTLGDVLLDTKAANPELFTSRKSLRMIDQVVTQSKSVTNTLDLNDNSGTNEEEIEESFELVEDVIKTDDSDEYVTLEEAQELFKEFLPSLEQKFDNAVSQGTTDLLNKLRGRID